MTTACLWAASSLPLWAEASAVKPIISKAELAKRLHDEFQLPLQETQKALQAARFKPALIEAMQRPYESRPYSSYRPLFVHPRLAKQGKAYLQEHAKHFADAEKRYGVQPQIIAAILGMETHYGRRQGKHRVLDALYTLAAGYQRRSAFFSKELGHLLLLAKEEQKPVESILGSYAGAFGSTQFIPSSYRAYAVDADHDGKRDVWHNPADIIASVAHYFQQHQWQQDAPVAWWLDTADQQKVLQNYEQENLQKWHLASELPTAIMQQAPERWQQSKQLNIAELHMGKTAKYALVHHNFYTITRWNRSYNYAMAASELAFLLGDKQCDTGYRP